MLKTFTAAMMNYFGLHASQTPVQFGKELLALSPAAKLHLWELLRAEGIECSPPTAKVAYHERIYPDQELPSGW